MKHSTDFSLIRSLLLLALLLGLGNQIFLGGTSMLIVVGVSLDTVRQLESQLMMRNYEGFLRKK